jgi:hypothetical protein
MDYRLLLIEWRRGYPPAPVFIIFILFSVDLGRKNNLERPLLLFMARYFQGDITVVKRQEEKVSNCKAWLGIDEWSDEMLPRDQSYGHYWCSMGIDEWSAIQRL